MQGDSHHHDAVKTENEQEDLAQAPSLSERGSVAIAMTRKRQADEEAHTHPGAGQDDMSEVTDNATQLPKPSILLNKNPGRIVDSHE